MERENIYLSIFLVMVVTLIGISGYTFIEGYGVVDSFYMTIITLTTTGFREVHRLSDNGKFFTAFLLVIGMGTVAYSATIVMGSMFSVDFSTRRRKKMEKKIAKMKDHTIVCGFGRMGKVVCQELAKANHDFVVIEQNNDLIGDLQKTDYNWIEGSAANDETLLKSGIESAKVLVSMIDNDGDGLYLSLAARSFNPNIYTVIRANHESARSRILRTGANKVILPYVMSGMKVAESILNPNVEDFLDITGVKVEDADRLRLIEIKISNNSDLIDRTLRNCGFKRDGLIIVGIKKLGNKFEFAPHADYVFQRGDCLISLGSKTSYEKIAKEYNL